jgi:NADPH:quinone reductase-like Zn-dependent oxidoreductase
MFAQEIAIEKYGKAAGLVLRKDRPVAQPGDEDVTVAVQYSGVNFADVVMRLGFYPGAPPRPFVPGYEISGHVQSVGRNIKALKEGDAVVAGTYFGGYASHVTIPAYQVFPLPRGLRLDEGAALPVNYFTSHLALIEMARVRAGDRVLVECASGGVGTIAIQMARYLGAEVVGLTTSEHKLPYIEALGAQAYTREAFYRDSSIAGFDVIINASGGKEIRQQLPRLAKTGRMVCLGLNSGVKDGKRSFLRIATAAIQTPRLSVLKLMDPNWGVFGLNALTVLQDPVWVKRLTSHLDQIERMKLKPHVDKVFKATEVGQAHAYLETRQAKGKVLLGW